MRTFVLLVVFIFAVGCKKPVKPTAPANSETASVKVQQPAATNTDKKGEKADEPNWLKDDRFTKKNDQLPVDGPANPGKQPWNVGAPPVPGAAPKPAGTGVLQPNPAPAPPGAATKPVGKADMNEVWVFIENASLASGKMPPAALTYAALVSARAAAAPRVKDGSIVLTGASQRESVWAFEAGAYLNGGLVATQNGVEALTAAELKRRLGK